MKITPVKSTIGKLFYLSFGFLFLMIGIIGLILPVLPGWIFLIPAAFCFAKSSRHLHNFFKKRKRFGKYFEE